MIDRPVSSRKRKPYHPTPLGPEYTEEELKRMRDQIPHGTYPGTYRKGQSPVKTSYYVPMAQPPAADGRPIATPDYAELLIASIPSGLSDRYRREYWEHSLLVAYYHLYGDMWSHWDSLIPWIEQPHIASKASRYGCEMPWDWMAKNRFLNDHGFRWSLSDLNRLIDRYPDYQQDNESQGMYIPGKTFEEISVVAKALNLPTVKTLKLLARQARNLNS